MITPSASTSERNSSAYRRFQLPIVYVLATVLIVSPWLHGTARAAAHILGGLVILILAAAWWHARQVDRTKVDSGVSFDAT
jgi:hypothetical protein